jgi:amino acid transporter
LKEGRNQSVASNHGAEQAGRRSRPDPNGAGGEGAEYAFTPLDQIIGLDEELADQALAHSAPARPATDEASVRFLPDGTRAEEADLTDDIFPAMPAEGRRTRGAESHRAARPALDLDSRQVQQGRLRGDRYVRVARPADDGFKRLSPGHLEALPRVNEPTSSFGRGFNTLKKLIIGSPLSTAAASHERLNKIQALAVFSSDALSSVAYASEAVLIALLAGGTAAFSLNLWVSVAIAVLIGIVIFSYRQTIYAYPKGGGSYIVAKDNLGTLPGLIAAASLMTDYVLTVAVSSSAGVFALISLLPNLAPYRVEMCLGALVLILLMNLRGIREAGTAFAVPTYVFLITVFGMLGYGLFQLFTGHLGHVTGIRDVLPAGHAGQLDSIGPFLILAAFSSGCTALTGIEAISDGVPAFKKPEARNAAQTLVTLGILLSLMFLGISVLADGVGARPSATESVVSQVGRTVFGAGPIWVVLQWATALILVLAANTAFSDFPRLAFFLARDRFLPHQFSFRGDRLAYSFGIMTLAVLAGLLIWIFDGDTAALLPLYAIGVFSSFTLSQLGMVVRWRRLKPPHWQLNATINAIGGVTTFVVMLILAWTKFAEGEVMFTVGSFPVHEGAWIVIALVPLIVLLLLRINNHYEKVRQSLSLQDMDPRAGRAAAAGAVLSAPAEETLVGETQATEVPPQIQRIEHLIVMPVSSLNQVTIRTLAYARSLNDNVVAVHVAADEEAEQVAKLQEKWHKWIPDVPLVIVESPYRALLRPLLSYIDALHRQQPDRILTVLIPEFVAVRWWENLLHNQSALRLKGSLLFRPGIVVTSVPYHIGLRPPAEA